MSAVSELRQLSDLNESINAASVEFARLTTARKKFRRNVWRASSWSIYLRLARWIRRPSLDFAPRTNQVMVVGAMTVALLSALLIFGSSKSFPLAFLGSVLGIPVGVGIFATLLFFPEKDRLASEINQSEGHVQSARSCLANVDERKAALQLEIALLLRRKGDWIASGKMQRIELLERDWKKLRGYDWENYLVEVFRSLGADVERVGQCGDHGCDLIVRIERRCIAIQAKGVDNERGVGNKAVQEAYTGMAIRKCNSCAVITNSYFRKSAIQAAKGTGCVLIGGQEFPELVMGTTSLESLFK